jgi:F-type H+-transporting ATPase subunit epsilon
MAHTPFKVEILTPEGEIYSGDVEMISTRTAVGSIGVLAGHVPTLAMLDPTELRLYPAENDVISYAQGEGYMQVAPSGTLILVDEVFEVSELDPSELQDRLQRAEEALSNAEEDSEEARQADRERRRNEAFLRIAEHR